MNTLISRRSFLGGVLAVSASTALPSEMLAHPLPTIHGDGINDDSPGLQALFDGLPVRVEGETFVARSGILSGGEFLLRTGLIFRTEREWIIYRATLISDGIQGPMITAMPGSYVRMPNSTLKFPFSITKPLYLRFPFASEDAVTSYTYRATIYNEAGR